jgi:Protein of unknown function (DUF998)
MRRPSFDDGEVGSGDRARALPAVSGVLAGPALVLGTLAGATAQPDEFSLVEDPPSDLGALTANSPWIANQIGSNLAGLLLLVFAIALWRSLGGHPSARIGSGLLVAAGVCIFLTGLFRLDCREMDTGCGNSSWHAQTHFAVAGLTALVLVLAPFVMARALKVATPDWRDLWMPTLGFAIGSVVAGLAGSAAGGGLGSLLLALVWFTWIVVLALRMLRLTRGPEGVVAQEL